MQERHQEDLMKDTEKLESLQTKLAEVQRQKALRKQRDQQRLHRKIEHNASCLIQKVIKKWFKNHRKQAVDLIVDFIRLIKARQALNAAGWAATIIRNFAIRTSKKWLRNKTIKNTYESIINSVFQYSFQTSMSNIIANQVNQRLEQDEMKRKLKEAAELEALIQQEETQSIHSSRSEVMSSPENKNNKKRQITYAQPLKRMLQLQNNPSFIKRKTEIKMKDAKEKFLQAVKLIGKSQILKAKIEQSKNENSKTNNENGSMSPTTSRSKKSIISSPNTNANSNTNVQPTVIYKRPQPKFAMLVTDLIKRKNLKDFIVEETLKRKQTNELKRLNSMNGNSTANLMNIYNTNANEVPFPYRLDSSSQSLLKSQLSFHNIQLHKMKSKSQLLHSNSHNSSTHSNSVHSNEANSNRDNSLLRKESQKQVIVKPFNSANNSSYENLLFLRKNSMQSIKDTINENKIMELSTDSLDANENETKMNLF